MILVGILSIIALRKSKSIPVGDQNNSFHIQKALMWLGATGAGIIALFSIALVTIVLIGAF